MNEVDDATFSSTSGSFGRIRSASNHIEFPNCFSRPNSAKSKSGRTGEKSPMSDSGIIIFGFVVFKFAVLEQ